MASYQIKWTDFEEHCKQVEKATAVNKSEPLADKLKRIARVKKDYKYFFEYYFPQYAKAGTSWFHILIAYLLIKSKVFKAILNWFRGSAKSTHATMGYPLWLMINGQLKTLLLVGQTEKKGQRLLGSLQAQLMRNQRFINDFGVQFSYGNWAEGEFITKQGIAFYAIGLGQDPRGTRNEENRPDFIIVDDCDSKKLSKNPMLLKEKWDWINEDLAGCFDVGYERMLIVNNKIANISIVASAIEEKLAGAKEWTKTMFKQLCSDNGVKMPELKGGYTYQTKGTWHHLNITAIDNNSNPTWPEKYTKEYWQEKKADMTFRAWEKEYMCNPTTEGAIFKYEWIKWEKPLPLREYDSLILYGDPSFKNTATSDHKAAKLWGKKGSKLTLLKSFVRQCSVSTFVQFFYDIHENLPAGVIVNYWMEANFLQDLILDEFYEEGLARGYQLPIRGDTRKKPDKFSRIESTSPLYERGFVVYNLEAKNEPDMLKAVEHLLAFEQGSRTPDDSPDADEGAISLLQQGGRLSKNPPRIIARNRKSGY
jgi:phage terminase large subunit-like protein